MLKGRTAGKQLQENGREPQTSLEAKMRYYPPLSYPPGEIFARPCPSSYEIIFPCSLSSAKSTWLMKIKLYSVYLIHHL